MDAVIGWAMDAAIGWVIGVGAGALLVAFVVYYLEVRGCGKR